MNNLHSETLDKAKKWDKFWTAFHQLLESILTYIITAWVLMLLWNWLMPELFKLPEINYWKACGLYCLSSYFFKDGLALHRLTKALKEK